MIEDFVQVMDIDNDDVSEDEALIMKITPRNDTIGLDSPQKSTDFCATVTARSLPEDDNSARAPVDIVVALDVSGSMQGKKLELCKETLLLLLRELSSEDRFGLVTFGNQAELKIPTRKLTPANRSYALAKIKGLATSGMTNMSGGIGLATNEIRAVESPHEVRTIFVLTDGHANVGVSDKEGIVELTKGCIGGGGGVVGSDSSDNSKSNKGPISIHCFGYGTDHDREMLRDISQTTEGGSYYFVDNDSNVLSAFGDALGGILSVVAQNVVVSINIPEKAQELGVSILNVKHEKASKQQDGSYCVNLGDFYSEESRDIIIETTLSRKGNDDTNMTDDIVPHLTMNVSYLDTIQKKLVSALFANRPITASISRPDGTDISPANVHVALQCIRIKTTQVISAAEKFAERNQLDMAKSTITNFKNTLQQEATDLGELSNPLIVQLLTEFDTILSGLTSRSEYMVVGSKYMQQRIQTHTYQRCSESVAESSVLCGALSVDGVSKTVSRNVYRSRKKAAFASKFSRK